MNFREVAFLNVYFVDPQGPIRHNLWSDPWYWWGFSGGQTGADHTHQSDHDHLEFGRPKTALG